MTSRHVSYDALGEPTFRVVEPTPAAADGPVLAASGELDRDTAGLLLAALERVGDASATIALDLGRLTFIDAAGARCLLSCRAVAAEHGMVLTVRNLRPAVRQVLDVLGILRILDVAGDPDNPA